jgi:hypothetical protein
MYEGGGAKLCPGRVNCPEGGCVVSLGLEKKERIAEIMDSQKEAPAGCVGRVG